MLSTIETRLENCRFSPPAWRPGAFETDGRLRRLEAFVGEHFASPISLAQAARQACLVRCYFSTYFRRHLGVGFH
jgi:AraC-like DNA-binding protein